MVNSEYILKLTHNQSPESFRGWFEPRLKIPISEAALGWAHLNGIRVAGNSDSFCMYIIFTVILFGKGCVKQISIYSPNNSAKFI